jgi:hypothetical protein
MPESGEQRGAEGKPVNSAQRSVDSKSQMVEDESTLEVLSGGRTEDHPSQEQWHSARRGKRRKMEIDIISERRRQTKHGVGEKGTFLVTTSLTLANGQRERWNPDWSKRGDMEVEQVETCWDTGKKKKRQGVVGNETLDQEERGRGTDSTARTKIDGSRIP